MVPPQTRSDLADTLAHAQMSNQEKEVESEITTAESRLLNLMQNVSFFLDRKKLLHSYTTQLATTTAPAHLSREGFHQWQKDMESGIEQVETEVAFYAQAIDTLVEDMSPHPSTIPFSVVLTELVDMNENASLFDVTSLLGGMHLE